MTIKATIEDFELLTDIAISSKTYWGYSKELIESWQNDLTVISKTIRETMVYKFILNQRTVGFYILNPPKGKFIKLEMLFVLPDFIEKGIGKRLLFRAFEKAKKLNANTITLLAAPNAVDFYKSQGFIKIDKKESSIPNRFLPIMQKNLT